MSKQVIKDALEAMCCMRDMVAHPDNLAFIDKHITALEQALAEPEQEPVMYAMHGGQMVGLYPAPTPRKPLTVFEIDAIAEHLDKTTIGWATHEFAAAIERAHGIGEQT